MNQRPYVDPSLPTIAILGGTGKEGPGLALRWASVGYPIIIGSRQLEKAQATAAELNATLDIGHRSRPWRTDQPPARRISAC